MEWILAVYTLIYIMTNYHFNNWLSISIIINNKQQRTTCIIPLTQVFVQGKDIEYEKELILTDPGRRGHEPWSKAWRAALTARSTSSLSPSAMFAITSPVLGSIVSNVLPAQFHSVRSYKYKKKHHDEINYQYFISNLT